MDLTEIQIKLKIKCTNVYDDETIENIQDVEVPHPGADLNDEDDLNEWAMEHLMQFTGTGRTQPNDYAGYFVEVLESPDEPALLGYEVESYG